MRACWKRERFRIPKKATPQGGVISPLLANIYLHYVLDEWFEEEVKPVLAGEAKLIRFADDFVLAFTNQRDAERRVFAVLGKRFAKYGLAIHPEKTRLVRFDRPGRDASSEDRRGKPETFDLLGFTWYWGRKREAAGPSRRKRPPTASVGRSRGSTTWCRKSSPSADPQAACDLVSEAARSLHVLCPAGQLLFPQPCVSWRTPCVAEVAEPPLVERLPFLVLASSTFWLAIHFRLPASESRPILGENHDSRSRMSDHVRICGSPGRATDRGDPAGTRAATASASLQNCTHLAHLPHRVRLLGNLVLQLDVGGKVSLFRFMY